MGKLYELFKATWETGRVCLKGCWLGRHRVSAGDICSQFQARAQQRDTGAKGHCGDRYHWVNVYPGANRPWSNPAPDFTPSDTPHPTASTTESTHGKSLALKPCKSCQFPPQTHLLDSCHRPAAESWFLLLFVTVVTGKTDSKARSLCPCSKFTWLRGS